MDRNQRLEELYSSLLKAAENGDDIVIRGVKYKRVWEDDGENEKLRELIKDMWQGMCGNGCNCSFCNHEVEIKGGETECEYFLRMKELGIK